MTELTTGNALVEGGTFLAILIGTIVAGIAAKGGGDPIHFAWLMMVTALASWVASLLIPSTGEGAPNLTVNRNIAASTIGLDQVCARRAAAVVGRDGGELVLARRRHRACRCCRRS